MTTTTTPIADGVAQLHDGQPLNPFRREQQELNGTTVSGVTATGTAFPDGALLDTENRPTSFREAVAGAAAVAIFYRGAWCPYCNLALATYRDQLAAPLQQRGVALVAISPQTPDGSLTMKEKQALDFAVLSDPGNQIAGALGILTHPSDDARAEQLAHGFDLTAVNADGTTMLPMPTVAIVDAEGALVWIDVHPDYSTRTEPQQVLDALEALGL